jgi:hypothetical protein
VTASLEVDQDIEVVQLDSAEEQKESSSSKNEPKKGKASKGADQKKHK